MIFMSAPDKNQSSVGDYGESDSNEEDSSHSYLLSGFKEVRDAVSTIWRAKLLSDNVAWMFKILTFVGLDPTGNHPFLAPIAQIFKRIDTDSLFIMIIICVVALFIPGVLAVALAILSAIVAVFGAVVGTLTTILVSVLPSLMPVLLTPVLIYVFSWFVYNRLVAAFWSIFI